MALLLHRHNPYAPKPKAQGHPIHGDCIAAPSLVLPWGAEGDSRNVYAKRKVEVVGDEGAGVVRGARVDCWWEEVLGVEVEGLLCGGENR